ncbi:MAG: 50S ribosomal protein L25 [Patescibacteria group bacterium]
MDTLKLKVAARTAGLKASGVRRAGSVPCVVYGRDKQTRQFQCDALSLHKAFVQAGESTLVELDLDGAHMPVLFKDVSFDPVSGREIHADFYAVDMQKEIETHVPVRFEGEAPACKELGAIFVASHNHVRVRCLPGDLPHDLPVSIAKLAAFHDVVTVANLTLPKGVTVMETPETVLALIQEPRREEEIAPPPAVEVAEGVVPAEGEAPKEGEGGAAPGSPEAAAPGAKEKK